MAIATPCNTVDNHTRKKIKKEERARAGVVGKRNFDFWGIVPFGFHCVLGLREPQHQVCRSAVYDFSPIFVQIRLLGTAFVADFCFSTFR